VTSVPEPPPTVLASFGLAGRAVRLLGGQGMSWRLGDVVLKPHVDPGFQEWLGTDVAAIEQRGFRLPTVHRAVNGAWVVEGWAAQSAVPGSTTKEGAGDWGSVIDASRALHSATAALARPAFLDLRTDPWARADRAAWGEAAGEIRPEMGELVARLDAALSPMGPDQLVHGDLTDNVLLLAGEPPSIIDFSPYWRPPSYAEGIVIADALCWYGAAPEILHQLNVPIAAVARGLLFRALTDSTTHQPRSVELLQEAHRYRSVLTAPNL
jgi:uncharacterized protein (TIGR02569 family)